ncbi:cell division protein FtsA [Arcobacter sp. FWKO B]|uniref:cell division protein FtsA n=1 Tax=Arcobacter sp. FWKO B TaxID=2593672 RepID=UPI0018A55932|nr:cell division protein FtsA [Arcobacter sp. FWKO B]QOG11395.1 cell division protein FtsA [Arcobacter sp. FWKO B]
MNKTILAIDIGTTNIITVVARNDFDNRINILGVGNNQTTGIEKGLITDIQNVGEIIKLSVEDAKKSAEATIDEVYVSFSAASTKNTLSKGAVNIPNGIITEKEINQVMQMALYNANIVPDYDPIHVFPIYFKVDDSGEFTNPLNMNASRLEVSVYIVTGKKTAITNVKSALKVAGIENSTFVLHGYASALSIINEEQKKFGVAVLDIGSSTSDLIIYKGNSIIYNDFFPVGSLNITNDLSVMLHTPPVAAEMVKVKYGSLIPIDEDDDEAIRKVQVPMIGNEQETKEISIDMIQTIIHARVEETLIFLANKIKSSGLSDKLGAGIIITGGMSKLKGIDELASMIFGDTPIKVANPKNIKNGYIDFNDSTMATTVGLLLYGLDLNPSFELDSNKRLRKSTNKKPSPQAQPNIPLMDKTVKPTKGDLTELSQLKKSSTNPIQKIWNKILEWF